MLWAIIDSNKVIEITEIDPTERYHESILCVPCQGHVKVGMTHDNGAFYFVQESVEVLITKERVWRNSELIRADEELNKVQDADPKSIGTVGQWREYRKSLRAYPEVEGFPSPDNRPISPV